MARVTISSCIPTYNLRTTAVYELARCLQISTAGPRIPCRRGCGPGSGICASASAPAGSIALRLKTLKQQTAVLLEPSSFSTRWRSSLQQSYGKMDSDRKQVSLLGPPCAGWDICHSETCLAQMQLALLLTSLATPRCRHTRAAKGSLSVYHRCSSQHSSASQHISGASHESVSTAQV